MLAEVSGRTGRCSGMARGPAAARHPAHDDASAARPSCRASRPSPTPQLVAALGGVAAGRPGDARAAGRRVRADRAGLAARHGRVDAPARSSGGTVTWQPPMQPGVVDAAARPRPSTATPDPVAARHPRDLGEPGVLGLARRSLAVAAVVGVVWWLRRRRPRATDALRASGLRLRRAERAEAADAARRRLVCDGESEPAVSCWSRRRRRSRTGPWRRRRGSGPPRSPRRWRASARPRTRRPGRSCRRCAGRRPGGGTVRRSPLICCGRGADEVVEDAGGLVGGLIAGGRVGDRVARPAGRRAAAERFRALRGAAPAAGGDDREGEGDGGQSARRGAYRDSSRSRQPTASAGRPAQKLPSHPLRKVAGMARLRTTHRCTECGVASPKWAGRCATCGGVEHPRRGGRGPPARPAARSTGSARPTGRRRSSRSTPPRARPRATGVAELDRVLGGGLVPGSVTLLGGEPGIGKSTLLLAGARRSGRAAGEAVLYVSAEESKQQVRARAERLGALEAQLWLLAETLLPAIVAALDDVRPTTVVVDSIQTVVDPELGSAPGSVVQVRECAHRLVQEAKRAGHRRAARRPRHQGRRPGRATRARARGRHRARLRGRAPPRAAAAAGGQAPLRRHERARPVRDDRGRAWSASPTRAACSWPTAARGVPGSAVVPIDRGPAAPAGGGPGARRHQHARRAPALGAGARPRPAGPAHRRARAAGRAGRRRAGRLRLGRRRRAPRRAGQRPRRVPGPGVVARRRAGAGRPRRLRRGRPVGRAAPGRADASAAGRGGPPRVRAGHRAGVGPQRRGGGRASNARRSVA